MRVRRVGGHKIVMATLPLVLAVACGVHSSGDPVADKLTACDVYASQLRECLARAGADEVTVDRQVASMRAVLRKRATTPYEAKSLNASCATASQRLANNCRFATTSAEPSL